jgi:hypothetical protein
MKLKEEQKDLALLGNDWFSVIFLGHPISIFLKFIFNKPIFKPNLLYIIYILNLKIKLNEVDKLWKEFQQE